MSHPPGEGSGWTSDQNPDHEDNVGRMRLALAEADRALEHDDVPVGAVVLCGDEVIASRHNEREHLADPTAHAELLALRDAAAALGRWRLDDCTLVVTLEPCVMCAGALVNARIGGLVFGASDPKAGAVGSLYDVPADRRLNHRPPVTAGVLADECGALLRTFFRPRRLPRSTPPGSLAGRKGARADEWDGLESR